MGSLIFNTDYSLFLLDSCLILGATSWTASGDATYQFADAILTPESFTGITFGGKLVVEAKSFVVEKPTTLSIPHLVLHLSDTFHIESTLTTNTLELYVKKSFTCGKSLIVNGDLTVHAPSLPTQHADIHASGNATLCATDSSIVVGDKQLEATESRYEEFDWTSHMTPQINEEYSQRAPTPIPSINGTIKYINGHTYCMATPITVTEKLKADLNTAFYHQTISNGVSVSAGLMLTLQSPQHIMVKGHIYSGGVLTLKADPQTGIITCEVGQIESLQDTYLYGHHYVNKRGVTTSLANTYTIKSKRWVSYGSEEVTYSGHYEKCFRSLATLTHHLYTDTPALLQAGGSIYFHLSKVENWGSTIAAAGSIYHESTLISDAKTPFKTLLKSRALPPLESKKYPFQGGYKNCGEDDARPLLFYPDGTWEAKFNEGLNQIQAEAIQALKDKKIKENDVEKFLWQKLPGFNSQYIKDFHQKITEHYHASFISDGCFISESLPQTYEFECTYCQRISQGNPYYRVLCPTKSHTGYLPSVPAYVLAGQTLSLNNSHVVTTGVTNAQHVLIDGHSVYAANIAPFTPQSPVVLGKHDRRIKDHLILDMTDFAFREYGSRPGFIQTAPDGRTVTKFALPSNLKLKRENILFLTESNVTFPYVERTLLDVMEPLFHGQSIVFTNDSFSHSGAALQFSIDLSAMQSVFQRMLTTYLHTQNVQGNSGLQALQYCFDVSRQIRKNNNSGLISLQQLTQYNDLYIVFQVMEQLKKILLKPLLIASVQNINQNTQQGDISGDTVAIKTTGDQTYIGQTVSGTKGVSVVAQNLNRETRKHRQTFNEWDQVITRETLEPQQVFYSKQGSITTFGRTLNREISTATVASGDVARGSDNVLVLDSHVLQTSAYNGDNGQTTHTFAPNHTLSGGTAQFSGDSVTLVGSTVQATDIVFDGGHTKIAVAQAINTRKESKTSGGGLFRAKKKHTEYQEIPVIQPSHLKAENTVQLKGKTAKLIGTQVSAKALVNKTTVGLEIAPATGMTIYKSESSSRGLFSGTKAKQNVGQEVMVATTLDVDKIVTLGAKLTLISTALGEQITVDDVYETASQELKSWKHIETKTTGIPAPILMIGSLALTIATAGSGANGIYAAIQGLMVGKTTASTVLAAASFKLLCSQMGANFIANGGHAEDEVKSVFSDKGMISLVAQIASAGVLDKMGISMPNTNASVIQIADYSARKVLINSGMNVAFGRESLSESLTHAGVNFLTDVVGILGANKIGSLYNNGEGTIDFTTHKLAHGGLGLVLGSLRGDPVAGALGGFVSEMVVDLIKDDIDVIHERVMENADVDEIEIGSPAFDYLVYQDIQSTMDWGKIASAVTAALVKKDVIIAVDVATNALENNFKKQIVKAIVKYFTKDGAKETVKQSTKQATKRLEKQALKEKAKEGFSHDTKRLVGKTDDFKTELLERAGKAKNKTTLRGAQRELKGEQLEVATERGRSYNHIKKVRQAQDGLFNHIEAIKNRLGFPQLPEIERQALQQELSEASKLLDYSKQFVPRK